MQQQQASHREQADLGALQRECEQLQGRLRDAEATSQVLHLLHVSRSVICTDICMYTHQGSEELCCIFGCYGQMPV